jgi:hypothetical protein
MSSKTVFVNQHRNQDDQGFKIPAPTEPEPALSRNLQTALALATIRLYFPSEQASTGFSQALASSSLKFLLGVLRSLRIVPAVRLAV